MRRLVLGLLLACGPRMEFTPHSAMQAQAPRVCQLAVEVFEGDVPVLQEAGAEQLGKLEVAGSEPDQEDIAERAAEHGATHMFRVARQRQLVQSGGMVIGTGGPGMSTGVFEHARRNLRDVRALSGAGRPDPRCAAVRTAALTRGVSGATSFSVCSFVRSFHWRD